MAIKCIGQEWCPDAKDYRRVYICDTNADISNLPPAPYGSKAMVAVGGKICMVNASGYWVDTSTGKVIPGAGVSSGSTGNSGGSTGGGVSSWNALLDRPFYDTREISTVEPAAVTGLAYCWGDIKISDTLDFDFENVVAVSGTIRNPENPSVEYYELWKDAPVYAGRMNNDENAPLCLMDANGSGWAYFIYIANRTEADWWFDGNGDVNPYTPGLYMCAECDSGMSVTAECSFTVNMGGELKTIEGKFLPKGTPYDTREYDVVKSETVVGTVDGYGLLKVSDNLDFDLSTVTSMNLKINGDSWYTGYPVEAAYVDGSGSPLGVFERFSDGGRGSWALAMYFANENEISWWFDGVPDGFTPGFYVNVDGLYNQNIEVAYSFEGVVGGELKTLSSELLPDLGLGDMAYMNRDDLGLGDMAYMNPEDLNLGLSLRSVRSTAPVSGDWKYITYGNGMFVAVAYTSDRNRPGIMYSTDGINWTGANHPSLSTGIPLGEIVYGNGAFIVLPYGSYSLDYALLSYDGVTWNRITLPESARWGKPIFINDKCIIRNNSNHVFESVDFKNWTNVTSSFTININNHHFASNGSRIVAVPSSSTTSGYYTDDGVTWTSTRVSTNSRRWAGVAYGNGRFVAIETDTTDIAYSEDGVTWTEASNGLSYALNCIVYGNGRFVAKNGLAASTSCNILAYSENGVNWTLVDIPDNNYLWTGIAFGDDKFVMVNRDYGYDGVTYSHDGAEWITTVDRFYQDNVDVTDRVLAMFKS